MINLGKLPGDYEAKKGDVLTGKLEGNKKITVAPGATVTLRKADITSLQNSEYRAPFAGITLLGDATVNIEGTNEVMGGYEDYPGILVPKNHTLTINGDGTLKVYSNGYSDGCCGIGGMRLADSGNIVIKGGNIFAIGGSYCAAIGSSCGAACGTITISGGKIIATGGIQAAGIGSGGYLEEYGGASCLDITITKDVILVTAIKGENAQAIGNGIKGTCGTITIEPGANVTRG